MAYDCIKQLQQELRKKFNDSEEVLDLLNKAVEDVNFSHDKTCFNELLKEAKKDYERTLSAER